jgi:hypothetical protein
VLVDQFASIVIALLAMAAVELASISPLATVLGTVKPSATDWIVIVSCGLLPVGIVEMTKFVFRRQTEAVPVYG